VNPVERVVRRVDLFQQGHPVLAFPFAVVQKYGNDQAGGKAVVVAYYGFFSLFPLLLLLTTITAFALPDDPALQRQVLKSALDNFPVVRDVLHPNEEPLTGSALGVAVGVVGLLYGTQGLGQACLNALNTVWNVPYRDWPNFWSRRLRGLAIIGALGIGTIVATGLAALGTQLGHGTLFDVWTIAASTVVNFWIFCLAFFLLVSERQSWKDVLLGAGLATVFWEVLQAVGAWYVHRTIAHATPIYGFFAVVIGLLVWLFVGAQLTLLAAETNVVRRHRLWPRSLTQPPLTDGDRRTFERLGEMEQRRPEMKTDVHFTAEARRQPLDELADDEEPGDEPPAGASAEDEDVPDEPRRQAT
jgi:YihY family inner membrane protein